MQSKPIGKKYTHVEGVRIELTEEQVKAIERAKAKRKKVANSFEKTLIHFGFKKIDTTDWPNKQLAFEHTYYNWYAEVDIKNEYWGDVWMVGEGLKHGSFPGGWVYDSPEDAAKAIVEALDKLEPKG